MNVNSTSTCLSICMGTFLLIWNASAQEQTIECKNVPAAVRTAFQNAYPKAVIRACAKEVEEGKTAYEISSAEGKTRRDVLFYEDGTLIVVEEAIPAGDLPEPVQQAVKETFPGRSIDLAEKVTREGEVTYEIRVKQRDELLEIVFDASGKEIRREVGGLD